MKKGRQDRIAETLTINLYDVSISTVLSFHLSFCFLSCKRLCDVVLFYFVKEVKDGLSVFCILFHHKILIYSHSAKGETGEPSK